MQGRDTGKGPRSPPALHFLSLVLAVSPPVTEHPGDTGATPSPSSPSRGAEQLPDHSTAPLVVLSAHSRSQWCCCNQAKRFHFVSKIVTRLTPNISL